MQDQSILDQKVKVQIIDVLLSTMISLTKNSLKLSDSELQNTLLSTVDELSLVKDDVIVLPLMEMLIHFIMVPTCRYPLIAVNKLFVLAENRNTNTELLYLQYKKQLCVLIVNLCVINYTAFKYDLGKSLSKISLVLGYNGTKDFVNQSCHYLLPYFTVKTIHVPSFACLTKEVARFLDSEISELLANKYGTIFLHVFLNESQEDADWCLLYLETTTGRSGAVLRKRNFKVC